MSVPFPTVLRMQELSDDEKAILDFEAQSWTYPGAKETAIVESFGVLAPTYYLRLNGLLDRPEALAHSPLLVKRLLRLRAARAAQRDARRRQVTPGRSEG